MRTDACAIKGHRETRDIANSVNKRLPAQGLR
jgi:hypothetical protein